MKARQVNEFVQNKSLKKSIGDIGVTKKMKDEITKMFSNFFNSPMTQDAYYIDIKSIDEIYLKLNLDYFKDAKKPPIIVWWKFKFYTIPEFYYKELGSKYNKIYGVYKNKWYHADFDFEKWGVNNQRIFDLPHKELELKDVNSIINILNKNHQAINILEFVENNK